jgi:hypothetical protein
LHIDRVDDLADAQSAPRLASADYALTFKRDGSNRTPSLADNMPISADPESGDRWVVQSGRFAPIAAYAVRGGVVTLYKAGEPAPAP